MDVSHGLCVMAEDSYFWHKKKKTDLLRHMNLIITCPLGIISRELRNIKGCSTLSKLRERERELSMKLKNTKMGAAHMRFYCHLVVNQMAIKLLYC